MNDLRCRPGDLAVVINAHNLANLGRVVRVIAPHDGEGELHYGPDHHAWLVECSHFLIWSLSERRVRRKRGPVPDAQLQPIRAYPLGRDIADFVSGECGVAEEITSWEKSHLSSDALDSLRTV